MKTITITTAAKDVTVEVTTDPEFSSLLIREIRFTIGNALESGEQSLVASSSRGGRMKKRLLACVAAATVLIHLVASPDAWAAGVEVVVVEPAPPVVVAPAAVVVAPVVAPAPVARAAEGGALLLGLALMGAGLVLGGAGFAVLYACRSGTACYGDTTQIVGWALAAPGVVPLVVGGVIVYGVTQSNGRRASGPRGRPRLAEWGVTAGPIPGGAFAGVTVTF